MEKKGQSSVVVNHRVFAKMANVSEPAITKAIQNFNLVEDDDGLLSLDDNLNNYYLIMHEWNGEIPAPKQKFDPYDADINDLFVCVKIGNKFRPIMALAFHDDTSPARMTFFPHTETIELQQEKGVIVGFIINEKQQKAYYTPVPKQGI
jgi:hypothetical protein